MKEEEKVTAEAEAAEAADKEAADNDAEDISSEAEPEEEETVAEMSEEEESWNQKYVRLMADFQNFKKRTEKDRADTFNYANEKIMNELLPVLDNFERALAQSCADEKFAEGMQMIFKQFMEALTKSGLAEIEALGKEFDPNLHNAVLTDNNDEFESGQITNVLQKGYTLNKKVIRPSMVQVNN